MEKIIEIKFFKSASKSYGDAIKLASSFADFKPWTEIATVNVISLTSEEIFNRFQTFERLYYLIRNWRGTLITCKGQEIKPIPFFQKFNQIIKCSIDFKDSIVKDKHCIINENLDGWSCKHLTDIRRHLDSNSYYSYVKNYWYQFGSFVSENSWQINKELIKKSLKKEAEDKNIIFCPHFILEKVDQIVDDLPNNIELENNPNWEIIYKEDFYGTTIQKKPTGIRHVSAEKPERYGGLSIQLNSTYNDQDEIDPDNEVPDNSRSRFIPETTFDDIGGIDNIIDKVREVIELPLKRPELYQHLGIKPHKGILFFGEPGNGKTMIAKAIANEVKAHFIPINGPELISKWYGESESNLRDIFEEARSLQPSIIFFDEIDSITQRRSSEENARLDAKFVNQLLTLMDGIESYENVTILASTNRPELLDEALLRPGRFDFKIEIHKPDEIGCYKILRIATKKMPLSDSLKIEKIVPDLLGCSGAEIVFIAKEAAISALNRSFKIKDLILENTSDSLDLSKIKVTYDDFLISVKKLKLN